MVKFHFLALTPNASEQATIKAALIYWRNSKRGRRILSTWPATVGDIASGHGELDQLIAKVSTSLISCP